MNGTRKFEMAAGVFYYIDNNPRTVVELIKLKASGFRHSEFTIPTSSQWILVHNQLSKVYVYYDDVVKGLGVKAREPLLPDEGVIEYTGERMSVQEYNALPLDSLHRQYSIETANQGEYISAFNVGNPSRFLNNNCTNPNIRAIHDATGSRVVLDAIKRIEVDEILTFKYDNRGAFTCLCKSCVQSRASERQRGEGNKRFSKRGKLKRGPDGLIIKNDT